MKLVKYIWRHEGQVMPILAVVQFGKQIECAGVHNGWYVVVNVPFFSKVIDDYVDVNTLIHESKRCFFRFGIFVRKPRGRRHYAMHINHVWYPTEALRGM